MAEPTLPGLPAIRNQLAAEPDLLRLLVEQTVNALLSADADAVCGAEYGERSPDRSNRRNGYRERRWDTRAGTIDLQIPKLREGSYFPDWLLERRRRSEKALISVVADLYLAGVSTRRVEKKAKRCPGPRPRAPRRRAGSAPRAGPRRAGTCRRRLGQRSSAPAWPRRAERSGARG